jgi:hypothetical protein
MQYGDFFPFSFAFHFVIEVAEARTSKKTATLKKTGTIN